MRQDRTAKRIKQILAGRKGFSLSEMLVVVVIVSLLSIMIATGVDAASRSYSRITDETNAEVLLSTTVTLLKSELTTATDYTLADDGMLTYKRGQSGYQITLWSPEQEADSETTPAQIYIKEYGAERPLVSGRTATNSLRISYDSIAVADGQFTLTGLSVRKFGDSKVLAGMDTLVIQNIGVQKTE